jgi:sucrose-6-phosphate hydrolase SacC (GH32 family)
MGLRFSPFYENGRFHLFCLLDWRSVAEHGEGTSWYQISTTDFVNFTEHGEMLARCSKKDQDPYVFTGSVIEGEGKYHILYLAITCICGSSASRDDSSRIVASAAKFPGERSRGTLTFLMFDHF